MTECMSPKRCRGPQQSRGGSSVAGVAVVVVQVVTEVQEGWVDWWVATVAVAGKVVVTEGRDRSRSPSRTCWFLNLSATLRGHRPVRYPADRLRRKI